MSKTIAKENIFDELSVDIVDDVIADDEAAITTNLDDTERLIDITHGMGDVACIIETIKTPTPTETALIDVVGRMAVAGTTTQSNEIVPAMESFRTGLEAAEWLKEKVTAIWRHIQNLLKYIWDKIYSFYYNIFGTVTNARKEAKALLDELKDLDESSLKHEDHTFNWSSRLKHLMMGLKPVENGAALVAGYTELYDQVFWAMKTRTNEVLINGAKLEEALTGFLGDISRDDKGEREQHFYKPIMDVASGFTNPPNALKVTTPYLPGYVVYQGKGALGNFALTRVCQDYVASRDYQHGNDKDKVAAEQLHSIQKTTLRYEPIDRFKMAEPPQSISMATLTFKQTSDLLYAMVDMLDLIEDYERKDTGKKFKEMRVRMNDVSEKLVDAYGHRNTEHPGDFSLASSFFSTNITFSKWVTDPFVTLISEALKVNKVTIALCRKSMSLYSKRPSW